MVVIYVNHINHVNYVSHFAMASPVGAPGERGLAASARRCRKSPGGGCADIIPQRLPAGQRLIQGAAPITNGVSPCARAQSPASPLRIA